MQRRSRFITINEGFTCEHCGRAVTPHPRGSCRNHCPFCLWSKHVDGEVPGDRASSCQGLMEPVGVVTKRGEQSLVQECTQCGHRRLNKVAFDDAEEVLVKVSALPQEVKGVAER